MNKLAGIGMVMKAGIGRRVMVVTTSIPEAMEEVQSALDEFLPSLDYAYTIHKSAGHERVEFNSGGGIRFFSNTLDIRGVSADVVFVDWPIANSMDYRDLVYMFKPVIATSRDGEIIRA